MFSRNKTKCWAHQRNQRNGPGEAVSNKQPKSQQPTASSQQSATNSQQPTAGNNQQPTSKAGRQQTTNSQQSATNSHQPNSHQPTASSQQQEADSNIGTSKSQRTKHGGITRSLKCLSQQCTAKQPAACSKTNRQAVNSQRPAANSQQYTATSNRQPAANSNIGATKAKELSKPGRITQSGYGTHTLLAGKL